jgi:hypothetical protein
VGCPLFTKYRQYEECFLILIHTYTEHENIKTMGTDGIHSFFSSKSLGVDGGVILESILIKM